MFKPTQITNNIARIDYYYNQVEFDKLCKLIYELDPESELIQDLDVLDSGTYNIPGDGPDYRYFEVELRTFEGYNKVHCKKSDPFIRIDYQLNDSRSKGRLIASLEFHDNSVLCLRNLPIKNVSILSNLRKLNLSNTNVTDVSALGSVHTLNIMGTKVTDVSSLGKIHRLYIDNIYICDMQSLQLIPEVYINNRR